MIMKSDTLLQVAVVLASLTVIMGYRIHKRNYEDSSRYRVMYNGEVINTREATVATSQTAHNIAQSIYSNFYQDFILNREIDQIDLTMLMDSSASLEGVGFQWAKSFFSTLIHMMPTSQFGSRIRVSVYTFSVSAQLTREYGFEDPQLKEQIKRKINHATYQNSSYTHLSQALRWIDSKLAVECRPAAKKILLVATDGKSNDDSGIDGRGLHTPVNNLLAHGVETFVVPLGNSIDVTKIAVIASEPDVAHIFHVKDTSSAITILMSVHGKLRAYYRGQRD